MGYRGNRDDLVKYKSGVRLHQALWAGWKDAVYDPKLKWDSLMLSSGSRVFLGGIAANGILSLAVGVALTQLTTMAVQIASILFLVLLSLVVVHEIALLAYTAYEVGRSEIEG